MSCLALRHGGRIASPEAEPADPAAERSQLVVPEDAARVDAEAAVFEALAQQVTAFVANLDEATVNVGAAEPHTIHMSSSSGRGAAVGGGGAAAGAAPQRSLSDGAAGSNAAAGSSAACSSPGASALFRRLRAAHDDSGFGWRERRAAFEAAMQRENRAERLVARGDLAGAEKRLQHRLLVARLEGLAFRGCTGGDSLFDALSLALWGSTLFGRRLRALAVAHAAQHPAEYSCFLGDDWQGYLSCMARPGTPGDELMLRAVSDRFGVPVNTVSADAFMWFQRYAPPRTLSQREVTLAYLGPSTWMPVRRQSAISSLRLTLSGSSEWRAAREVRRKMAALEGALGMPPDLQ
ncbi:OTU family cysteine protease [Micractinium conductrix]|uniref:OTU family cysteine protease n=1 Tax=Micractinium conductrix TaxID=554055 RepID=A0A2P6VQA9_9CHLO|nr:OTU family cysteine protease [Micractinium conductrix]|eukprot:PSC76272.1 OTU family cysteine protease [Micractinium conductrix]